MGIALDYTARIDPAALKAVGVTDVCRYLCYLPTGNWKVIRKGEYDELLAAGINVTLNWELDARDWAHGEGTGQAHGTEAVRQAKALGYPAGCVIIGSADFDMTRSTWDSLAQHYARGFAAAIRAGGYQPGVYGPYDVLTWCRDTGLFTAYWQAGMSTAWSGGRNRNAWPGVHLRQRRHLTVAGQDTDLSDIHITPWGQARAAAPHLLSAGDDMPQMLVKAADGQHWLVDGMFRRPIAVADLPGVGNGQSHQAGFLGNLGNNGQPYVSTALSSALDGWGIDIEARIEAAVNAKVDQLAAADLARDTALAAAVSALAGGGTSIDTAAVIAAVNAAVDGLRHRFAAAEAAEAAALDT